MGMDVGGGEGPRSEINVTPLVDVVLVLLIIFMVVQPLLQMGYDVQVPPKAQVDQPIQQQADQIVVTMTADRHVYLNKERIEIQNLPVRLSEILRNRGSKVVFFSVEDSVNYGEAMGVMDQVRNNGAKNIGIVMDYVDPTTPSAAPATP
ncbi:biopolymer transporter ExbD [Acidobacteria bacterium ACD]|nr:MAG: biopolymer transporter ExbD [Acidobacteriota bacterium]MCE7959282.1 biopolymer transporter ExbD [Acidobacteria bacterium ACB2]MDL1949846.1 biopolymer transporter ExbD [Acidobacteria bacterium ACD]